LGLNPSEESSGGKQRLGSISKQGNSLMRHLLVEAGQSASKLDPELRRNYQRLKFRKGGESGHRTKVGGATVLETARSSSVRATDSHAG
jgi:transposase